MLDKILNSFGSILKFFGVMIGLIVIASIFMTFYHLGSGNSSQAEKIAEVKSVETQTKTVIPEEISLADQLNVKISKIKAGKYNDIAEAYQSVDVTLVIENNTGKILKGFSGKIFIKDAFGDFVKSVGYKNDEDIPVGSSTQEKSLSLNVFDKDGQRLAGLKKWTTEFKADVILTD